MAWEIIFGIVVTVFTILDLVLFTMTPDWFRCELPWKYNIGSGYLMYWRYRHPPQD